MRRRAAVAVLLALVVFVAAQLGFGTAADADPRLRDRAYADKSAKLRRLRADRPVLVLGSSRTLLGFHAERFVNATGREAFNFGTPAAGPITHLVHLNRLLNSGLTPGAVLVEVLPPLFADGPDGPIEQSFLTGERLTGAEVELVEGFGFSPDTARPKWQQSVAAPVFSLRCQLLSRVAPGALPWQHRYDWGRNTDARGWATPPRTSITADERAEQEEKTRAEYAGTLAALDPDGRPLAALRRVVETCRGRGIPVALLLMPEGSSFRALYPAGLNERVKGLVNAVGVPLIDARLWLADDDLYDGHHPFTHGAEKFTDRLAADPVLKGVLK